MIQQSVYYPRINDGFVSDDKTSVSSRTLEFSLDYSRKLQQLTVADNARSQVDELSQQYIIFSETVSFMADLIYIKCLFLFIFLLVRYIGCSIIYKSIFSTPTFKSAFKVRCPKIKFI